MSTARELCEKLIHADHEDDVVELLKAAGYWDSPNDWRDLGDNENNFAPAGAQQSNPIAALVEKIVNSADARLMNEALMAGIEPTSDEAPRSVREAVAKLIEHSKNPENESRGRIENWTNKERNEEAQKITLAATGSKSSPSITITDIGEGQVPDDVPDTFMSVNRSNKLRVHFVQGKFNMGGTGALRFCGKQRIQLVVTRRNPNLIPKPKNPDDKLWSFTVVRRDAPKGGEKSSVYRYLAPLKADKKRKGGVLRFSADKLKILPYRNDPYNRYARFGSLIKLYNYEFKGKSNILMKDGLLRAIDVRLPNPALPVMFHECRKYAGGPGSFSNPCTGLFVRLSDNKEENLAENFPLATSMTVEGQNFEIRIFGFKRKRAATYLNNSEGVLFHVNGQTQGVLHSRFYKRNSIKLNYIHDSLLTCVDCSNLDRWGQEELFMNTRENLAESDFRIKVEKALETFIHANPALREFNNQRREELVKEKLSDDKPLEDTLRTVLASDPTLAALFLEGNRLSAPHDITKKAKKKFVGKKFPTYFRHYNKDDGYILKRECQLGREFRLAFETDAEDNYFGRPKDKGKYTVRFFDDNGDEVNVSSHNANLFKGICNISFALPDDAAIGSNYSVEVSVTDDSQVSPFLVATEVRIVPLRESKPTKKRTRNRRGREDNEDQEDQSKPSGGITLPTATLVPKEDWDDHDFDKYSALKIMPCDQTSGQKRTFDFFLNIDNLYLSNELKRAKTDESLIKKQFEISMILIGLSMIHNRKEDMETEELENQVLSSTRAIAMVLLPMLRSVTQLSVDERAEINDAA